MTKNYFAPLIPLFFVPMQLDFFNRKTTKTTNKTENFNTWTDRSSNIDAIGSDVVNLTAGRNVNYTPTDLDSIKQAFDFSKDSQRRAFGFGTQTLRAGERITNNALRAGEGGANNALRAGFNGLQSLLSFADNTVNTAATAINNAGVISQNKEALKQAKPTQTDPFAENIIPIAIAAVAGFLIMKKFK